MRILAENTTAVMIDFQERLMPAIDGGGAVMAKAVTLVRGLKALGVPVLVSEQYKKGLGATVPELESICEDLPHLEKTSFSCLDDEKMAEHIASSGRKNVIVFGVEAHICVLQTVIDLAEKGYTPVLAADCSGSRKESDKKYALKRAAREGALITTCEAVLFELARYSGTGVFKEISKLVK